MKKKEVFLTERDLELFTFLFKGKVSTVDQIHKHIFKGVRVQVVNRRLKKLCQIKAIRKGGFLYGKKARTHYSLTTVGLEYIKKQFEYGIGKVCRSDSIEHDLVLNDIRNVLEKKNEVSKLLSENELQCIEDISDDNELSPFVELNSDGVAQISKNNEQLYLALEYDASIKSSRRYSHKLTDYYKCHDVAGVLYIADKSILTRLKNVEQEVCKRLNEGYKFFYSNLQNVLSENKEILFVNQEGLKIAIS